MDKKLKARWVKALRSGKYKQCTGKLTDKKGGYCCLGVLQRLVTRREPPSGWDYSGSEAMPLKMRPLNKKVRGWSDSPHIVLAQMNDGGKNFSEIADYIEKNL